jgi:hypothetical protein
LILADEVDGFTEWADRTQALFESDSRSRFQSTVCSDAAALAQIGAAAVAWQRRRWSHLRILMDLWGSDPRHVSVLGLLQGNVRKLLPWAGQTLAASPVLRGLDAIAGVDDALLMVFGVLALRHVVAVPKDDRVRFVAGGDGEEFFPVPSLFAPGPRFVDSLANECLASRQTEAALAKELFGVAPEVFRGTCAEITPVLDRLIRLLNPNTAVEWMFVDKEQRWKKWCGGAAPERRGRP